MPPLRGGGSGSSQEWPRALAVQWRLNGSGTNDAAELRQYRIAIRGSTRVARRAGT